MSLTVEQRTLAQAEPHEIRLAGPVPLLPEPATEHHNGSYRIFGPRPGLTVSVFDIQPGAGAQDKASSGPCISLTVLFQAAGQGWLTEDGQQVGPIPYRPGFYCMIAPEGANGIDEMQPDRRFTGVDIRIAPDLWRRLGGPLDARMPDAGHPCHEVSSATVWTGILPLSPQVSELATTIRNTAESRDADLTIEARSLDIIAAAIAALNAATPEHGAPGRDRALVRRVTELIAADLAHGWTVADLAAAAGTSLKHLKQVFPQHTGLPVYRYLQETRLQAAHDLLIGGESVTQTALTVGYGNLSHFSAQFRRRFGKPPSVCSPGR